ncbi:MAG: hypothetical protein ACLP0L_21610 [Solirubrobacteraceae bacterium]
MSKLRVYHRIGAGRPIRVVWSLEEVGADYELGSERRVTDSPLTRRSSPTLRDRLRT